MAKPNKKRKPARFITAVTWAAMMCLTALPCGAKAQAAKDIIKKNLELIEKGNEPDTAVYYRTVDETLRLAEAEKDYESMATCYKSYIVYLTTHSWIDRALEAKDRMISLWESTGKYDDQMFESWQNIVQAYYNNNNIVISMAELQKMRKFAADRDNHYGLACAYIAFGTFYASSYDTSMRNLKTALAHLKQSPYAKDNFYIYYAMAFTADKNEKWKEALGFISQMEEAAKDLDSDYVRQIADFMRLNAYVETGDKAHAKECFGRLNALWEQYKIYGNLESSVVYAMIQYHCQFGNPDEVPMLLKYITEDYEDLKYAAEALYYKAKGNYRKALECFEKQHDVENRQMAEQQEAEMANANAYLNNQQLEAEKQQMTERYQRNTLIGVTVFAILLAVWIVYLILVLRKLRRAKAALQVSHDTIVEQNEKVKASEEMKTAFIQSMSHEIRTPLNHIVGFSSLLTMGELSPEERQESVENIQKATTSMTRIVDNMLQMSDIISSTEKPQTEEVCLNALCRDIIANVSASASAKRLDISLQAESDYTVKSNAVYLANVMRNLLENAVKFTDEGSVIVALQGGEATAAGARTPIRIAVSDTGRGIPKDKHEYVFERFTKVDEFVPGVGIGLYLCRLMTGRLGGRIFIDPDYTGGCRIVVELPAA